MLKIQGRVTHREINSIIFTNRHVVEYGHFDVTLAECLLRSQNRAWQYCMKFHNTIRSRHPCHHLSWLTWSCGLPNFWTKADLSVMQLFLRTHTNWLLTKPSLFNSAVRALQTWKCFYMFHIAVSLYIFSFCFQIKSWNKDSGTKPEPLFSCW